MEKQAGEVISSDGIEKTITMKETQVTKRSPPLGHLPSISHCKIENVHIHIHPKSTFNWNCYIKTVSLLQHFTFWEELHVSENWYLIIIQSHLFITVRWTIKSLFQRSEGYTRFTPWSLEAQFVSPEALSAEGYTNSASRLIKCYYPYSKRSSYNSIWIWGDLHIACNFLRLTKCELLTALGSI